MCGFAGVAGQWRRLSEGDVRVAAGMAETLRHRGPDASGLWSDADVALAHQRLAILDLTACGAQPMASAGGRYVVAFNGEIYNYRYLGEQLQRSGWQRRGGSDTEVLLAGVEAWGLDTFLQRADGMFAFALYDRNERRLSLVRDRFGEKPLVYAQHDGMVVFASELRALTRVPGLDLSLDRAATADYFRFGYVPGVATIYHGVRRVAPATVVEVDLGVGSTPRERRYWEPPTSTSRGRVADSDRDERLLELLSTSVRDRLVSDRPVGAFLSGGVDSSLICALAAQHTSGPLKTFTMGWEDVDYDESAQAEQVARALGSEHHDVRLGRGDVAAAVTRLGTVMDEPFADSSQLAVLLVATAAREHVVVALSGDGGDELFAGYNRHRWLLTTESLRRRLPAPARRGGARVARRAAPGIERLLRPLPTRLRRRLVADKVRKLSAVVAAPSIGQAYQHLLAHDVGIGRPRELAPELDEALAEGTRDEVLAALRLADLCGYLPDDVLTKVDRATMAVSLESRTPFLHADLVDLAFQLDATDLLGPSGGKQPLRRLLTELLPGVPFDQPKTGFGVPLASLLRNELRPLLADAVSTHRARQPPLHLDWTAREVALAGGDDAPAPMLWSLLAFELWADAAPHEVRWQ